MTKHHPKETTLAEYAAGTLDEGRSLVVTEHLSRCAHCREFIASFENIGGVMMEAVEPVDMSPGARDAVLRQLGTIEASTTKTARKSVKDYSLGPWRWIGPGLHARSVGVPSQGGSRVFMLKAAPGIELPKHEHRGTELTCILSGAFTHEGGRYGPGDCDDADEDDFHSPVIDNGEECVCLVAMQGNIVFQSLLGRMIQPFIRL